MASPKPNSAAAKLLADRILARRRLLHFTKLTHPRYSAGWVHDDICRRLERFSREVAEGKSPRLMLLMPPRHGKSELASIRFPAWHLGQYPHHELINVGYNLDLPMGFSRKVREVFRDPQYQAIFPDAVLDPDSQSVEKWNTTKGGGFTAAGRGGGITGKGAHILIVDDPIKDQEEADSALVREKLWDWYQSTAYTRLAPGGGVLVIQCMTGDTPVALPNGGTVRLDAMRPGDMVATYRKGSLSEAAVAAVRSCGRDSVYRITTTSGKVVRANGRHPFLALHNGELKWVRTQALNTTHAIVAVKGSGVSGAELSALRMAAPNRPSAEGSAPSTMHSASGQTDTAHQAPLTPTSGEQPSGSTFTVSPMTSTAGWLQLNMGLVPSVSALPTIRMYQKAGAENFASTTTTQQDVCAGSSAIRATSPSDILDLSPSHLPQQHISDFVLEGVVSVEPAGEEEVFDLQIAGTANFIANGLVSHNTWWNDDDLAGRLQQAMALIGKEGAPEGIDDFEIIKYPALSLSYEYRDDFDPGNPGPIIRTDEPIDVTNPPLGMSKHLTLLRPKDFCLHEDRYPTEALKRIRANLQPRIWSALYQQNPVPDEGMYFRKEYFRYQRQLPSPAGLRIYTAWDFAIGEKQANDWTVGATILQDEMDQLYVLEIFRMKGDSFQIVEAMLDVATRWGSMPGTGYLIGAEDGQIWRAIEPLFKKRMVERRQYIPYEVLRPMTDKMARARPLQGRMQQGRVIFPEEAAWRAQAEQELLRFPAGVHDDVVDALAWAVQLCMGKEPPQAYTPPPLKSWRDRLSESFAGSVSHMSA